jgi:predicted transcriptional regulator
MPRTSIEFNDAASEALSRLSDELGKTKAEVLRDALSLYSFLVTELGREGGQLGILRNGREVEKIIAVPGLQTKYTVAAQLAR